MAEAGERVIGTRDENHDVISVLYHCLQAASEAEQYIQDAEQRGDRELVDFFRDHQDAQKDLAERAKNLLGARLARARAVSVSGSTRVSGGRKRQVGAQTNASVQSGGRPGDDIVDEESKESFPASDAPARY